MFEIVQSMRDEPLTACPECGGELRKVFAPPAIAFKGSGFYATDHGKKSKKPAEKGADKPPEKSSEGAGDKPAATAGGKDTPKPADKRAAAGSPSAAGSSSSGSSS